MSDPEEEDDSMWIRAWVMGTGPHAKMRRKMAFLAHVKALLGIGFLYVRHRRVARAEAAQSTIPLVLLHPALC